MGVALLRIPKGPCRSSRFQVPQLILRSSRPYCLGHARTARSFQALEAQVPTFYSPRQLLHTSRSVDKTVSLIDEDDLLDFQDVHASSISRPASNVTVSKELFDEPLAEGNLRANPAQLERFQQLIHTLEAGVAQHGPVDRPRLVDSSSAWRKLRPDAPIDKLSPNDDVNLGRAVDAMLDLNPSGDPAAVVPETPRTNTKPLLPSELPYGQLSAHPAPLPGAKKASSLPPRKPQSKSKSAAAGSNHWWPLMQDLLKHTATKPSRPSGDRSQRSFSTGTHVARSHEITRPARHSESESRAGGGQPPSAQVAADLKLAGHLRLNDAYYYPPELYARVQPAQSPMEAICRRQEIPDTVVGTPLPADHPLITRSTSHSMSTKFPSVIDPSDTTTAVEANALDGDKPNAINSDAHLGSVDSPHWNTAPIIDTNVEAGKSSQLSVNLPLQPGDLVELFVSDSSRPLFGIIIAAVLPDANSGRYQMLSVSRRCMSDAGVVTLRKSPNTGFD
ncbi:hypothetical protein BJ085DRAFT_28307 [Dimargaris cristalligena]|uniref:Uncharacterized protein n=1 Tax=Dimargaris cristalligena TaxID=215637 RepID=A0A4P9ZZI8_9FUNG|nr:hypothetical protein BJ085DRAFT_28307 [Dimargaris cristalligena]|eukprot:RKP38240.1 hypothetical protein BJ085DRAFT_28307 [Dimargaris cristalligena]